MKSLVHQILFLPALFACLLFGGREARAAACGITAPNITTAQYNSYRTSANQQETVLNPTTVASGFGYLFEMTPAAGLIYAQPLILHNLTVSGTCYATVVLLATMQNTIIAYDGDNAAATGPIWQSQPFATASTSGSISFPALYCRSNVGFTQNGILSTPVIDATHLLMYFVTLNDTQEATTCTTTGSTGWVYTLHAMSLKNDSTFGLDYIPAHDINGDLQSYGFVAGNQLQRPALADAGGAILIGFGFGTSTSGGDEVSSPYQGWMAEYNSCASNSSSCTATTCLTQTNCTFQLTTLNSPGPLASVGAGVWMSGVGPSTDGTFYAYATGNGCRPVESTTTSNCAPIVNNALGDSVIYRPAGTNSNPGSTFTPEDESETPGFENYYVDDYNDLDLDTGGVMMIPPPNAASLSRYLVASGKAGQTYLLQTANLGGYDATPYQNFFSAQSAPPCAAPFPVSPAPPVYSGIKPWQTGCAEVHGGAYWSLGGGTGFYFVWGFADVARGYFFNGATFDVNATDPTPPLAGASAWGGGGALAISSNGAQKSSALLWAVTSGGFQHNGNFLTGILSAHQLYSTGSGQYVMATVYNSYNQTGNVFTAQRYVVPLVNNGKVYVSTVSGTNGRIFVYGPCSQGAGGVCGVQPN